MCANEINETRRVPSLNVLKFSEFFLRLHNVRQHKSKIPLRAFRNHDNDSNSVISVRKNVARIILNNIVCYHSEKIIFLSFNSPILLKSFQEEKQENSLPAFAAGSAVWCISLWAIIIKYPSVQAEASCNLKRELGFCAPFIASSFDITEWDEKLQIFFLPPSARFESFSILLASWRVFSAPRRNFASHDGRKKLN